LTECQKYAGTKLQDVCQYEGKKAGIKLQNACQYEGKKQRIKCSLYILDARNQNRPQGIRINHRIVWWPPDWLVDVSDDRCTTTIYILINILKFTCIFLALATWSPCPNEADLPWLFFFFFFCWLCISQSSGVYKWKKNISFCHNLFTKCMITITGSIPLMVDY
jgi:hypothetical protein